MCLLHASGMLNIQLPAEISIRRRCKWRGKGEKKQERNKRKEKERKERSEKHRNRRGKRKGRKIPKHIFDHSFLHEIKSCMFWKKMQKNLTLWKNVNWVEFLFQMKNELFDKTFLHITSRLTTKTNYNEVLAKNTSNHTA